MSYASNHRYELYFWELYQFFPLSVCVFVVIDLPVASLMRTKYGEYPEYHTSLDTFGRVVTANGLKGSLNILKKIIYELEKSVFPIAKYKCEPQLGKKGLYPSLSKKNTINQNIRLIQYFLSYSDGQNSILDIAKTHLPNACTWCKTFQL